MGGLSLASAVLLATVGVVGVVALLVGLVIDADVWSDSTGEVVIGIAFFALTALGAVGFYVMDHQPWAGAALAVVGGLALALVLFWAIVPVVLGLGAATVAVIRARALSHPTPAAPRPH